MKVVSNAENSRVSFLHCFQPSLSVNLSESPQKILLFFIVAPDRFDCIDYTLS